MKRERELTELPRGLRRRVLPTAKIAAKAGVKHLLRFAGSRRRAPDAAAALLAAANLVEDLGSFKGLFMKFGQMASYLSAPPTGVAEETLARLQDASFAFAFDEISKVVEAELGGAPDTLFERFARRPAAAASIGQVHRARLDGRSVAVKVQYPGIEAALRSDLAVLAPFVRLGTFGLPTDGRAILAELRDRVREECDYREEAGSQRIFARVLSAVPFAKVPAVVESRSSRRVLTSEWVDAAGYRAFRATASRAARGRAGLTLFHALSETAFGSCICNADPQPGNYFFDEDGSVTFIDFGCVRRLDPDFVRTWKRLARCVLGEDRPGFQRAYTELGFVPNPRRFDWDHQWEAFRYMYGPLKMRGSFRFTREFVAGLHERFIYRNPNALRSAMPPPWLMLFRAQMGQFAILADLGAEARWGDVVRRAIDVEVVPVGRDAELRGGPSPARRLEPGRVSA